MQLETLSPRSPLASRSMFDIAAEAKEIMTFSQKLILLVEDDEESQELVILTLNNYKLVTAFNFVDGLYQAQQQIFDLYILDNWLPDGAGVELCRRIREFDLKTPILFYSAAGYKSDTQEAIKAGAQEYLIKPVDPEDLKQIVMKLIFQDTKDGKIYSYD